MTTNLTIVDRGFLPAGRDTCGLLGARNPSTQSANNADLAQGRRNYAQKGRKHRDPLRCPEPRLSLGKQASAGQAGPRTNTVRPARLQRSKKVGGDFGVGGTTPQLAAQVRCGRKGKENATQKAGGFFFSSTRNRTRHKDGGFRGAFRQTKADRSAPLNLNSTLLWEHGVKKPPQTTKGLFDSVPGTGYTLDKSSNTGGFRGLFYNQIDRASGRLTVGKLRRGWNALRVGNSRS